MDLESVLSEEINPYQPLDLSQSLRKPKVESWHRLPRKLRESPKGHTTSIRVEALRGAKFGALFSATCFGGMAIAIAVVLYAAALYDRRIQFPPKIPEIAGLAGQIALTLLQLTILGAMVGSSAMSTIAIFGKLCQRLKNVG